MTRFLGVCAGLALAVVLAAPVYAEKCPFSSPQDPHERDESDPPLRCRKCEEIAQKIAHENQIVWTLDLKYRKPRRVEIKTEGVGPEVYWFVSYELSNLDTVPHPCFVDVTAESDKGKKTFTYHDSAVPEVVEECRKILGIKDGEQLFTQADLCMPPQGTENTLPDAQHGDTLEITDRDGKPLVDSKTGKPSSTRFLDRDGIVRAGPAKLAFSTIQPGETRKCVAIFKKIDAEMDVLTVYFHGLTNTIDAQSPETVPVGDDDLRIVNDDPKTADPYRRKVIDRIFAIEFECPGDEFAKSSRPINAHDEQLLRPKNLAKDPTEPPRYHDVGIFGKEIVEPEEKTVEGKKACPFTFLAHKWIQVERTIKSDLR